MPVFYRGPRAYITHRVIEVPEVSNRRYRLGEITAVHVVVDEVEPVPASERATGVSALVAALVQLGVMGPVSVPLAVLLFVALGLCAGFFLARRPRRRWRLQASCRGRAVELFASENAREFSEVRRGLVRALEYHEQ